MCCLTVKCLCSTNAASPRAFRLSHALVSNISSKVSKVSNKVSQVSIKIACAQQMSRSGVVWGEGGGIGRQAADVQETLDVPHMSYCNNSVGNDVVL